MNKKAKLSRDELHAYALMMGWSWQTAGDRYSFELGAEPLLRLLTKENKALYLRTYWNTNFGVPNDRDARCRIAAIIWADIYLKQQEEQQQNGGTDCLEF